MDNTFPIAEIFISIQGEGIFTGAPAIFVRFADCNLHCEFCDTDFSAKRFLTAEEIVSQCNSCRDTVSMIIFTGGEPLLFENRLYAIVTRLTTPRFLAVETNGTKMISGDILPYISWVSMSPKLPMKECGLSICNELKILFPYQEGVSAYEWMNFPCRYRFIQPIHPGIHEGYLANIQKAIEEIYRLNHYIDNHGGPVTKRWRLGIQTHKLIKVR